MTEATSVPGDENGALPTRFGPIRIDPERAIHFRYGLFGFGTCRHFVLADVPGREVPFKLLQSADDPEVGFLVLPMDPERGPIASDDLERACVDLGIDPSAVVALSIVTLRAEPGQTRGTVNLKAPILIDSRRREGCQYVLDDGYQLQASLPMAS